MTSLQQQFDVQFRYQVHFTTGLFALENNLLADTIRGDHSSPQRTLFVVDDGVAKAHPGLAEEIERYAVERGSAIDLRSAPILVAGGEAVKNGMAEVSRLQAAINAAGLCRHSFIVAIGGGAVLDMAGFAAATAHRGIRLIRVPTTVLAQNDSGVGVKTSVNAFGKKNFLGSFTPPYAVINDSQFLESLSDRDWRGGIAEAVKVALIKDADFFEYLEQNAAALVHRSMPVMQQVIYRCAELHLDHIASGGDPFESGSARPLDYGHWAAHKLEQLSGYRLRHGEAVAIGIALDTTYSFLTGKLPREAWERTIRLLLAAGFELSAPELSNHIAEPLHPACILAGLAEFREHLGGELTIILLDGIGHTYEVHDMDCDLIRRCIDLLSRIGQEENRTDLTEAA